MTTPQGTESFAREKKNLATLAETDSPLQVEGYLSFLIGKIRQGLGWKVDTKLADSVELDDVLKSPLSIPAEDHQLARNICTRLDRLIEELSCVDATFHWVKVRDAMAWIAGMDYFTKHLSEATQKAAWTVLNMAHLLNEERGDRSFSEKVKCSYIRTAVEVVSTLLKEELATAEAKLQINQLR